MKITLDGKRAGLQDAKELKKELSNLKMKEDLMFSKVSFCFLLHLFRKQPLFCEALMMWDSVTMFVAMHTRAQSASVTRGKMGLDCAAVKSPTKCDMCAVIKLVYT